MKFSEVDVNVQAFKSFKSVEALKKEPGEIFKHLGEGEEDKAYQALWDYMNPEKPKKPEKAEGVTE